MNAWRAHAAVIVGNAAAQTALVAANPVPQARWGFGALAAASLFALVAAVWLTVQAAIGGREHWRAGLAWSAGVVLLAAAAAVLLPLATPVILIVGLLVLPAAADGEHNPVAAGLRTLRQAPLRATLALIGAAAAIATTWLVALLLGFFLTGTPAAFATWLWAGLAMTVVVRGFAGVRHVRSGAAYSSQGRPSTL